MPSQSAINLGQAWSTPNGSDLSSPAVMASGLQCVAEAILRRWTTSPGELIDDPTYGYNLSDLLSDDLTKAQISYAQQQAGAQAQLDERVLQCTVTITLTVAGLLTVVANVLTAAGPFKMVAAIGAVTTQLLLVSP